MPTGSGPRLRARAWSAPASAAASPRFSPGETCVCPAFAVARTCREHGRRRKRRRALRPVTLRPQVQLRRTQFLGREHVVAERQFDRWKFRGRIRVQCGEFGQQQSPAQVVETQSVEADVDSTDLVVDPADRNVPQQPGPLDRSPRASTSCAARPAGVPFTDREPPQVVFGGVRTSAPSARCVVGEGRRPRPTAARRGARSADSTPR